LNSIEIYEYIEGWELSRLFKLMYMWTVKTFDEFNTEKIQSLLCSNYPKMKITDAESQIFIVIFYNDLG